jgi:hypothetical protein
MPAYFEHTRRSIRLPNYDYASSGAYFVTVCAYERECLFGEIRNGEKELNEIGNIVADEWIKTAVIRHEIILDEYVIMPNHFHGIVWIRTPVGAHGYAPMYHDAPTYPDGPTNPDAPAYHDARTNPETPTYPDTSIPTYGRTSIPICDRVSGAHNQV